MGGVRIVAVAGATATGKSSLAMALAEALDGEIVGCDSVQVYRGADIGSAKVGPVERRARPHHGIDLVEPGIAFTAADWVEEADRAIAAIVGRGRVPIVVGGSGLYLRSLWFGLSASPPADVEVRAAIEAEAAERGWEAMHGELQEVDPRAAERIHPRDRVRVSRALEVWRVSGVPISAQQEVHGLREARYEVAGIGLAMDRRVLAARIAERSAGMLQDGLVEEVRRLLALVGDGAAPPLDAIGYREVVAALAREEAGGEVVDAAALAAEIARNTRRFARRQRTWFRRQVPLRWGAAPLDGAGLDALVAALRGFVEGGGWQWGCTSPEEALVCAANP